jgi:hypothetical protein
MPVMPQQTWDWPPVAIYPTGPLAAAIPQAEELYVHNVHEIHHICMMHTLVDAPDVHLKEEEAVLSMCQSQ